MVDAVILRSPHAHARICFRRRPRRAGVWHIEMPVTPSGYGVPFVQLPQKECRGAEHPMSSPRAIRIPPPRTPIRRDRSTLLGRISRWRKRARWVQYKLKAVPKAVRIVVIAATILAVFSAMNLVYQVLRKPTEVFAPVSGTFNKTPIETWRQYAPLFREYSTASISPELLAALAQVEGAGNPVASTYWRWRLTWNPFAIYQPASSSVGMYQMTDAAFAEARHYCIRDHVVVESGCSLTGLDSRVPPSRAIGLAAVFLDRKVTAILARPLKTAASARKVGGGAGSSNGRAKRGCYHRRVVHREGRGRAGHP
jgi:hypothetical protein